MKFCARWFSKPVLILFFLFPLVVGAISLTVSGDWTNLFITANDLTAGSGSQLNGQYSSHVGQMTIDILDTQNKHDAWRVDVKRTDTTWSSIPILSVKRSDSGSGKASITGGLVFQTVGTTAMEFFSGKGERTGVNVQLQISNISLSISPGNYSTTITYTVVNT